MLVPRLIVHRPAASALAVAALLVLPAFLRAQPSGGPYGPQPQTYAVPPAAAHVYYIAPDGRDDSAGTALAAPTTLESALNRVVTGDAVILRGGTYRTGGLVLNQGITLQPYRDEQPVLKGTEVAAQWEALRDGLWRTKWKTLFPCSPRPWWRRDREGSRTPLHRFNNDMVFVDGRALQSAGWEGELTENTYSIDYEGGYVYIKQDPAGHLVEITARDSALVVTGKPAHGKPADHRGPAIRGLTFTQYAYRALEVEGKRGSVPATAEPTDDPVGLADPATLGKEVVGTLLEHCALTHCSRVAGYFRGDGLVIRHCLVSDTSTEGIYVIASADCLIEKNIITRNNVEQLTGYYPAAVKIFNQTRRVVCRDNLILDHPNSSGVWYDVGNVDGVFVNNWVEGCVNGFYFEISSGATCAGNVFVNCNKGVRVVNSRDARVYHNTFVNAAASFERDGRSNTGDPFGWHITTGPEVERREGHVFVGNILAADASFARALLNVEQSPALRGRLTASPLARLDGNLYVRAGDRTNRPLVSWSPAPAENYQVVLPGLPELTRLFPAFETHGHFVAADLSAVLRSPVLRRLDLVRPIVSDESLPAEIRAVLGWPDRAAYAPGAYQTGP